MAWNSPTGDGADVTPDGIRALRADITQQRSATTPFEIVIGGRKRGEDGAAERALIASLGEAGTTWSIEYIPVDFGNLADIRARISAGPLRT